MAIILRTGIYLLAALFISSIFLFLEYSSAQAVENNASQTTNTSKNGYLIRDSALHQHANLQSDIISELAAEQAVKIQQRERAWYRIITGTDIVGWTSMLNVRFSTVSKREGELGVKNLLNSMSKSTTPTQSTGIRGFDEVDLKKAKPNYQQLEKIDTFAVKKEKIAQFALQGQLKVNENIEVQP